MNLPKLSIRRPVAVIMAILSISLIGMLSLSKLKLDLLPDLNIPTAVVTAKYEGAGPREIETYITKPFESVLTAVSNLKSIETVSTSEYSLCILNFDDDTDMNFATLEMREKIDLAKTYLPEGVSDIMIMRIDPNSFNSTFELGITSDGMSPEDLTRLAEEHIVSKLERIDGIASVTVSGGITQEVRIELIPERLALYGLNEPLISQYLTTENLNIPAGRIETSGMSVFLRTVGEFTDIEEIRNLPVPTGAGSIVLLKDIAHVSMSQKEKNSESYINGKMSLNLLIQKQSNANTVMVCRGIRDELSALGSQWPDMRFDILYDASTYIEKSLETVSVSAVQGGILAALILYLFLLSIRATLIIAVSMPVSIITTFVLMYFTGINLNLISLAGLALGVGMLVDNSIVVLENIYRYDHMGMESRKAAERGAGEVMLSISAATLTTVVVFIPIIFLEGMTGRVFKEMGLTITFSLMSSMIISVTFIPMMASRILNIHKPSGEKRFGARISNAWERFYGRVRHGYERMLKASVRRKGVTILTSMILLAVSLLTIPLVGFEYFPSMDEGMIEVELMLPKGSSLSETHDMAFRVQDNIRDIPEITDIIINLGNGGFVLDRSTTEKAVLSVYVGSVSRRKRGIKEISDEIREKTADISGSKIKITDESKVMGFSIGSNEIEIRVYGEDIDTLKEISNDIIAAIENVKGIYDLESSLDQELEEASIRIDRKKAAVYGLTTAQAGQAVQSGVNGVVAARYRYKNSEINIMVSSQNESIRNLQDLKNLSVQSPRGASIPLSELAEISLEKSPSEIVRVDQKRTVSITAAIGGRALNKVTEDMDRALSDYRFPSGYSYSYAGKQKELADSFDDLSGALILSLIIVYMLLAAQFESLLHPFTILLTVPLGLTGALLSLLVTGKTLSVPAFIGIIMLVGIVVDNAIVLIDCINQFRKEGMGRDEAIIKAGPLRLRPILMTTLTTILGMFPMALDRSEGSEILVPLAVVVIGGLFVSTFVTLLIIPSFYAAFDQVVGRMFHSK